MHQNWMKKWHESGGCMINATKVNEKMSPEWRMHDKKMATKWRMHDNCNQSG